MGEPFIGSEALAAGALTRGRLAAGHRRLFPDVYLANDIEATAVDRARAAWLWSRHRGVVAGFSASAMHGSGWVDADQPAELIHQNRHRLPGLRVRGDHLRLQHRGWIVVRVLARDREPDVICRVRAALARRT